LICLIGYHNLFGSLAVWFQRWFIIPLYWQLWDHPYIILLLCIPHVYLGIWSTRCSLHFLRSIFLRLSMDWTRHSRSSSRCSRPSFGEWSEYSFPEKVQNNRCVLFLIILYHVALTVKWDGVKISDMRKDSYGHSSHLCYSSCCVSSSLFVRWTSCITVTNEAIHCVLLFGWVSFSLVQPFLLFSLCLWRLSSSSFPFGLLSLSLSLCYNITLVTPLRLFLWVQRVHKRPYVVRERRSPLLPHLLVILTLPL
jgi:hypothetical protein